MLKALPLPLASVDLTRCFLLQRKTTAATTTIMVSVCELLIGDIP
jgi:hypothetical protein